MILNCIDLRKLLGIHEMIITRYSRLQSTFVFNNSFSINYYLA